MRCSVSHSEWHVPQLFPKLKADARSSLFLQWKETYELRLWALGTPSENSIASGMGITYGLPDHMACEMRASAWLYTSTWAADWLYMICIIWYARVLPWLIPVCDETGMGHGIHDNESCQFCFEWVMSHILNIMNMINPCEDAAWSFRVKKKKEKQVRDVTKINIRDMTHWHASNEPSITLKSPTHRQCTYNEYDGRGRAPDIYWQLKLIKREEDR